MTEVPAVDAQRATNAEPPEAHQNKSIANDSDLAEQRRMASQYQPDFLDPLISDKLNTDALWSEFCNASEVYQIKVTNLRTEFGHYRKIRGDGSCGFRAFYFGLLEVIIEDGSEALLLSTKTRFGQLNKSFEQQGLSPMIYEEWVDATDRLLDKLIVQPTKADRLNYLLQAFNNDDETSEEDSRMLLTHLRFLTAQYIRLNSFTYQSYIQGKTVEQYTKTLETVSAQMDEIALTAAHQTLARPLGVALDVLYLDQSQGDQVSKHRYETDAKDLVRFGTITMLYRPGHYDLAYVRK